MQSKQVNHLKPEVERTFGRRILSSADCTELRDHILQKTGCRLSFNTLRRFFQLMRSEFNPSANTLNILAKYCSYASFDDFLRSRQHEPVQLALQEDVKLVKYLVLQFNCIEVQHSNDPTYLHLVRQTIHFLNFCPEIIDQLQREIAKTRNGQTFYFEYFVHTDKLNSYYGDGLKYYLQEKNSREAQVFGHSLLCMRYWLINDQKRVEKHCEEVMKLGIDKTIHPFVCARYFASQLFRAHIMNRKDDQILTDARAFYYQLKANKGLSVLLPCYLLNLAESLVLTGENKEALYYIEEGAKQYKESISNYVDDKLFYSFRLYQALALAGLGRTAEARDIFKAIDPRHFYFLSKQYHTILYMQLKRLLQKRRGDPGQLAFLIEETGFVKLWGRDELRVMS